LEDDEDEEDPEWLEFDPAAKTREEKNFIGR
jgi:hypothetical protein